jgi:hypothetical protein
MTVYEKTKQSAVRVWETSRARLCQAKKKFNSSTTFARDTANHFGMTGASPLLFPQQKN